VKVREVVRTSGPWLLLMTAAFVVMKLAQTGDVATWSWWWVFAPLWAPIAVVALISGIVALWAPGNTNT